MALTSVERDPFARGEYLRQSEATRETGQTCAWCGQRPRTLYRYAWRFDDLLGRGPFRNWWGQPVCNLRCHHAYHG
jgi:hypothetical protein